MKISDILCGEEGIEVNLVSTSKNEVLTELIDLLCRSHKIKDFDHIKLAIFEREKLSSTGICNGLAIPHAKVEGINSVIAALGISKKGVDFQAMDHLLSHIFFVLVSPKDDHGSNHVKTLAKITKILKDEAGRKELMECNNSLSVLNFIKNKEEKV
ncbi:MAG: PTS sugar transporter subunit IIA [Spirochaetota bacterium]|nr:PTS sugar transporter subunit IIA [Spirochaetota bacterium]